MYVSCQLSDSLKGDRSPITCDKGRGHRAPLNRSGEHTSEVRLVKRLAELSAAPRAKSFVTRGGIGNLLALSPTDVQFTPWITKQLEKP